MCFSATASFTLAATTALVGLAAVRQVRQRPELFLAIVPLLFAAQQAVEGLVWLQLSGDGDSATVATLSFTYLLFANIFWPVYTAVAVLLIEPDRRRRRLFGAIAAVGSVLAIYLFIGLLGDPATAVIRGNSIDYTGDANPLSWRQVPYVVCICAPLLLSSHRIIQVFGAVVLAGFLISAYAYVATFVSVWCFFAAADSTLIWFYFRRAAVGADLRHP